MGKLTRRKRRHNKNNNNTNNDHSTDEQLKQEEKYNNDNNNSNPKNLISRGTIFQFIISWFVIGIVVNHMSTSSSSSSNAINNNSLSNTINITTNSSHIDIDATTSASASTGNNNNNAVTTKFEISKEEVESYHEIIKIPKVWKYVQQQEQQDTNNKRLKLKQFKVYNVIDFTSNVNGTIIKQFGPTNNESTRTALTLAPHQKFVLSIINIPNTNHNKNKVLSMGRYNEIRKGMYTTSLFQNDTYTIDSYKGERIVHIGIDMYASANTKIYSFSNGIIHSFGYNPQKGDYGYVIVIEYDIITTTGSYNKLWALYGHLSKRSIKRKHIGNKVKKGQVIGYIGAIHENGGWSNPHVHFQLSIHEPETHDMPGVVSMHDRDRALIHYPDPRMVLGPLY